MKPNLQVLAIGSSLATLLLGLAAWTGGGIAADGKTPEGLPDAEYGKLTDQAIKQVQEAVDGLAAGKVEKKLILSTQTKAKVAAVMIAVFAQNAQNPATAQERATLRDAALKLAEAIGTKKYAEAQKLAAGLKTLQPNPAAKPAPIPIFGSVIELDDLMIQFKPQKLGADGIELKLEELDEIVTKKKELPAGELTEELALIGYRCAIVAELIKDHDPGKNKKKFEAYALDMGKASKQLVKDLKAKDGKAAALSVQKLNKACVDCHKDCK